MHRLLGPKRAQHLASTATNAKCRGQQDTEQVPGGSARVNAARPSNLERAGGMLA
jgi:hypothetical protein